MTAMRYDCSQGCFLEHRWDPATLDGCLPRGSSLINADGWAEIGGHFLFVEHKRHTENLSTGQRLALKRLASLAEFTVIVLREEATPGRWRLTDMGTGSCLLRDAPLEDVRAWVRAWGAAADAHPLLHLAA